MLKLELPVITSESLPSISCKEDKGKEGGKNA